MYVTYVCIHGYVHACIHTYVVTYMHTYMHTYIHTRAERYTNFGDGTVFYKISRYKIIITIMVF